MARDLKTEVRRIARDVPLAKSLGKPFVELVNDLGLQATTANPLVQHALEVL